MDVIYNGEVYSWSKHHEWEKFSICRRARPSDSSWP